VTGSEMIDRRGMIAGALGVAPVANVAASVKGGSAPPSDAGRDWTLDRPDLQQQIHSSRPGSVLTLPVGMYVSGDGGFVQTHELSWRLDPGAVVRGEYQAGRFDSLLTVRIDHSQRTGDFRGGFLTGGRFLAANPDYVAGRSDLSARFARGGYAIDVSATGPGTNILNYRITQTSVSGGTGAVRFAGTGFNQTVAWSGIERSTLINGVVCEQTADGMMFRDNVSDGVETAYRIDLLEGAFCCTIDGGSTGNRHGALDVVNGSMWRLTNCQMEHGVAFAGKEPSASTVIVRGTRYRSYLGVIERNNFGAGIGRVLDTIVLQAASGTVIDANYFFLSDRSDIRIESSATGTIVGARNMGRGHRPVRPVGAYTDRSRRLVIALKPDARGQLATGTRGVWHPAGDVLGTFSNGWRPEDMEILLTEEGLVCFNGGLTGGAAQGDICTFPAWLLPHQHAWLHATVIEDGSVRALRIDARSGRLSVVGALPSARLNLSNATYPAVLDADYTVGP